MYHGHRLQLKLLQTGLLFSERTELRSQAQNLSLLSKSMLTTLTKISTKNLGKKCSGIQGDLVSTSTLSAHQNGHYQSACRHRHSTGNCKCNLPIYHPGQDEAVLKQNALPSHYWTVQGRSKLRPKTEGQGIMVSASWDEYRGFGLPLT